MVLSTCVFEWLVNWLVDSDFTNFLLNFSSQMSDMKQITTTQFSARCPSITPTTLTWYLSMVLIDQPTPRHLSIKPRFHLPFCLKPLSDRPWLHEMCSDSGLSLSELYLKSSLLHPVFLSHWQASTTSSSSSTWGSSQPYCRSNVWKTFHQPACLSTCIHHIPLHHHTEMKPTLNDANIFSSVFGEFAQVWPEEWRRSLAYDTKR